MRRATGYVLAAIIAATPMGAQADSEKEKQDEARIVMRDFAQCLVGSFSPKRVQQIDAFLAVSPYAPGASDMARKFVTAECLSSRYAGSYVSRLQMPPPLLRGALFRARFERQFAKRAVGAFAPYDVKASWHVPRTDRFALPQAIGECAVREDPVNARAVIDADVGSKREDAAFAALVPTLQKCMPSNGTFRFSRAVLEALLAEALYNLSLGAAPVPAGDTK